jgi:hypothetical protein
MFNLLIIQVSGNMQTYVCWLDHKHTNGVYRWSNDTICTAKVSVIFSTIHTDVPQSMDQHLLL